METAEQREKGKKSCCDAFLRAQQDGTDNEGYGRLVYAGNDRKNAPWFSMGTDMPMIRFCPWCGAKLRYLETQWQDCMMNNATARASYKSAQNAGLNEEYRLKASVVALSQANDQMRKLMHRRIAGLPKEQS